MSEAEEKQKRYINILFQEKLLQEIDDFRFKNRMANRNEAIRWLIEYALKEQQSDAEHGQTSRKKNR